MQKYLTTKELAEMLRAPEETIRYWAWKGTGPKSVKVGRRRLYSLDEVTAWLERKAGAAA
jgi:excisionase family DNA binding protein